ncbi:MAG: hypothetical protein MHMPM18_001575 [Marteilia pararefringens]
MSLRTGINRLSNYFTYLKGQFERAIELYTIAINIDPKNHIYYVNRSFAYFQLKSYTNSIVDATKAVELDENFIKGYYRRALAFMELNDMPNAIKDFEYLHTKLPSNKDITTKLSISRNRLIAERYRLALCQTEIKTIWETLKEIKEPSENNYSGPRIDFDNLNANKVNEIIEFFKQQKMIHSYFVAQLILRCNERFKNMPNITRLDGPNGDQRRITICGDIHGQFYDFLNIFAINGMPSPNNIFIFNGDFVDRGEFSVEVILVMLLINQMNPNCLFLNRGNHENHSMNCLYGFEAEVKNKFKSYVGDDMYIAFKALFEALPICTIVGEKIFIVHGGVPGNGDVSLEEIENINRFEQIPDEGIFCDLLWADPHPSTGTLPSSRGISHRFGSDITERFLSKNNLSCVVRSHEMQDEGYSKMHHDKCVTIFSAPNYCNTMNNKAAFIGVQDNLSLEFTKFNSVSHPVPSALGIK